MKPHILIVDDDEDIRSQLRWAGEHLYYWLVLGPVVVGFTAFTVARVVDNLGHGLPFVELFEHLAERRHDLLLVVAGAAEVLLRVLRLAGRV